MVALFIWAGTLVAGDGALGVRLLSPAAAMLGTLLLARAAEDIVPGRCAGPTAALLLNATLLAGVGAVTMTPDTPLLLFWTATLAALGRLLATGEPRWWLVAGLAAGLALDSKYTAVLLAPALLAWLALAPSMRPWLRRPWPYLGALLALLTFAPVLAWNAGHGWAGLLKQGGRVGDYAGGQAAGYLAELVGGQVGLATPGLAVLFVAGTIGACRRPAGRPDAGPMLLACVTLLPLAVFVQHALGDRVQANWPAVVFPSAAISAAGLGAQWRRWLRPAAALGAAMTGVAYLQATLAPLALPPALDPTLTRLGGWDELAREAAAAARREGAAYIAVDNYGVAAALARAAPGVAVVGIEQRWARFRLPSGVATLASGPGLLLRPARRTDLPDPRDWAAAVPVADIARGRGGVTAEAYRLYRVLARPGGTPSALLPHPGARDAPADR